jgi:hypothetical protein
MAAMLAVIPVQVGILLLPGNRQIFGSHNVWFLLLYTLVERSDSTADR